MPYLDLVIETLVKEADAEAQIFTILLLLPEKLCLAGIAEGEAVAGEALLHLASMRVDVTAQGLHIYLFTHQRSDEKPWATALFCSLEGAGLPFLGHCTSAAAAAQSRLLACASHSCQRQQSAAGCMSRGDVTGSDLACSVQLLVQSEVICCVLLTSEDL